jgi:hypothetical protein
LYYLSLAAGFIVLKNDIYQIQIGQMISINSAAELKFKQSGDIVSVDGLQNIRFSGMLSFTSHLNKYMMIDFMFEYGFSNLYEFNYETQMHVFALRFGYKL